MSKFNFDEVLEGAVRDSGNRGPICSIKWQADHMDEDDRVAFLALVNSPGVTASALARAFRKQDLNFSQATVARHRRGDCMCGARDGS